MTVLTILGSLAAIIVAVITIWNTTSVSHQRAKVQTAIQDWRSRKLLAKQIDCHRAEPALLELEHQFDALSRAYHDKDVPDDLARLWATVFRLAGQAPLGTPFKYGSLEVHRDVNSMTIRKGSDSITGTDWLDPLRIPLPPRSAVKPPNSPIAVVKD